MPKPPPDYRRQEQPPSTQRDLFSDFYPADPDPFVELAKRALEEDRRGETTPIEELEQEAGPTLKPGSRFAPDLANPTAQRAQVVQDVAIDLSDKNTYAKWLAFHITNPVVYNSLRTLALEAKERKGVYGIKALVEIARWERRFTTEGDVYKMPNAYSSLYARFLMEREPTLREFFNTAELRTATWPTDQASVDARTRTVA